MAGRLLFELFIFSLPFLVFGLYLLATRSAVDAGQRKWPVQLLFAPVVNTDVIATRGGLLAGALGLLGVMRRRA